MAILNVSDGLVGLYLDFEDRIDRSAAGMHAYFLENQETIKPIIDFLPKVLILARLVEGVGHFLGEGLPPDAGRADVAGVGLEQAAQTIGDIIGDQVPYEVPVPDPRSEDVAEAVLEPVVKTIEVMVDDRIANDNRTANDVRSTVIGGLEVNVAPVETSAPPPTTRTQDYTELSAFVERAVVEQGGVIIGGAEVNGPDAQAPSNDNIDKGLAGVLEIAAHFEAAYWERHADDSQPAKDAAQAQFDQARSETIRHWEERQPAERERETHDLT